MIGVVSSVVRGHGVPVPCNLVLAWKGGAERGIDTHAKACAVREVLD
jgi:hypothetical protein